MTPEAQHWQRFIQSLTDRRQEIVRKANLPTTRHRDAHDLLCSVTGYDFAIDLAVEYRNAAEGVPTPAFSCRRLAAVRSNALLGVLVI